MRRLVTTREFRATGDATVLSFDHDDKEDWFWGYLSVDGRRTFEVTGRCDTCPFSFARLAESRSVDLGRMAQSLRDGADEISDLLIEVLSRGLPAGEYMAALLDVVPIKTEPGDDDDYFTHEQRGIWEPALSQEGGRHDPHTAYYRLATQRVAPDTVFYEFLVPLHDSLSEAETKDWSARLLAGMRPVALGLGVGELREPATWTGEPDITKHLCISHYLLDGHHRVEAAGRLGLPIRLLTALAVGVPPLFHPKETVLAAFRAVTS